MSGESSEKKKSDLKHLTVNGVNYKVVGSVLVVVDIMVQYIECASMFPSLCVDVITGIVETLRTFDSRTDHLVLHAGAMDSAARLRSISAKHLACTMHSLSFLISVLPHSAAALMSMLEPRHHFLLHELDSLVRDLQEHHGRIVAKFVTMVNDFTDAGCAKLRTIDWDRFHGRCEYLEDIQKNVSVLHKVLSDFLSPPQLKEVFSKIFSLLSRKLVIHFEGVQPLSRTGKQHVLDAVGQTTSALGQLLHVDAAGMIDTVEAAFKKKYA